jgi:hypothetical protein
MTLGIRMSEKLHCFHYLTSDTIGIEFKPSWPGADSM